MALPNYNDLLSYLGLSNWQFIALTLLLLVIWAIAATLWKMGALKKVKVLSTILPPLKCVYISFLGSYDYFDRIYSQSVQDFQMVFKFSSYFSIFYDNPSTQNLGAQSKALIGVFVSELQQPKIKLFLSKFPQYKVCDFPKSKCLSVDYPLIGSVSSILAIGIVYPALEKKVKDLKLTLKYRQILEIYHSNQQMSIVVPIENEQGFQKWYEPTAYSRVQSAKSQ